jgi:hypothetical protein
MQIFREYIAPFLIVLVFFIAMIAVSARIFLPNDMLAPAPIEETAPAAAPADNPAENKTNEAADETASVLDNLDLSALIQGIPQDLGSA